MIINEMLEKEAKNKSISKYKGDYMDKITIKTPEGMN